MKNLSISIKLLVGFGIVLILMLAAIVASVYSISRLGADLDDWDRNMIPETTTTWNMRRDLVSLERYVLMAILEPDQKDVQANLDAAQTEADNIKALVAQFEQYPDAPQVKDKTDAFLQDRPMYSERSVPIIIPQNRARDIDTPEDWEEAELLLRVVTARRGADAPS